MNNVSKGLVGALFATTAAVSAAAQDCLNLGESTFISKNVNISGCIKDRVNGLFSATGRDNRYALDNDSQLTILNNRTGKFVGEIDMNWDTVQVEASDNDIPYTALTKKAQGFYNDSIKEACAGFKRNLSVTVPKIEKDIGEFKKVDGVTSGQLKILTDVLAERKSDLAHMVTQHCEM